MGIREDSDRPREDVSPADVYLRLNGATSADRTALLLELLASHPDGRLELPARDGQAADLEGIDLSAHFIEPIIQASSPPRWWNPDRHAISLRGARLNGANLRHANLEGADLRQADLRNAVLRQANLRHALLEEADLQGADLAGADLQHAQLGEANLEQAMLEEANLEACVLRFANLRHAVLESANLRRADLWSARLEQAVLADADLETARLVEANLQGADLAGANLQRTLLFQAQLQGADLRGAKLQGARLRSTNFADAVLRSAQLQYLDFSNCNITQVHLSGTRLDETRFHQQQLGGAIGEELALEYEEAAQGYLALERNFLDLGDADAASWAYRKRRRMQKHAARRAAGLSWKQGRRRATGRQFAKYASDQLVEWLCDYGESIPRVLASILVVYLVFTLIYGLTGSVMRVEETAAGTLLVPTRSIKDVTIFGLISMTASEGPTVRLLPQSAAIHYLTSLQTLLGVALTGLLGFVLGNRIRR